MQAIPTPPIQQIFTSVDGKEQVIVAVELVDNENDVHQVDPMIQLIWATLGYKLSILLSDVGYFSYDNLELLKRNKIDAYIPDYFDFNSKCWKLSELQGVVKVVFGTA